MSHFIKQRSAENIATKTEKPIKNDDEVIISTGDQKDHCLYAVTVSKKASVYGEDATTSLGVEQKSFISIHSTDQPCPAGDALPTDLDDCNVEVLSLNQVFPSDSEDSLSDDETPTPKKSKRKLSGAAMPSDSRGRTAPTAGPARVDSRGRTAPAAGSAPSDSRGQAAPAAGPARSDYDLPRGTLHVVGSNPGEPKKSYTDPPKRMSKTMKKFFRNIDKHKGESTRAERPLSKLTTARGILKDSRCGPECTGDSQRPDDTPEDLTFTIDYNATFAKQNPDKNVTFNTQVVIIHFSGDLCVGQSVESLSKEKDQQARNSELRKTFLMKYNELWPTQK